MLDDIIGLQVAVFENSTYEYLAASGRALTDSLRICQYRAESRAQALNQLNFRRPIERLNIAHEVHCHFDGFFDLKERDAICCHLRTIG